VQQHGRSAVFWEPCTRVQKWATTFVLQKPYPRAEPLTIDYSDLTQPAIPSCENCSVNGASGHSEFMGIMYIGLSNGSLRSLKAKNSSVNLFNVSGNGIPVALLTDEGTYNLYVISEMMNGSVSLYSMGIAETNGNLNGKKTSCLNYSSNLRYVMYATHV